jgi:peptidoglycan lytic transglycosylase D
MLRSISAFFIIVAAFLTLTLFSSSTDEQKAKQPNIIDDNAVLPQTIKSIPIDKVFSFAGEEVPIDNFDVYERLDRELLRNAYYHSSTVLSLKRSKRYFPVIEKILAENGIPEDFKYLAVAESDLSNAVSPAGAKGVWQFLRTTGKAFGLESNSEIEERYHLEKSTEAACEYLKSLHNKFGNWTMAAAAYNMGETKLRKEKNIQRTENYFDLNLNQETSRYVFRILALKEIMSNPGDYGFLIEESEKYAPIDNYETIEINGVIANWGDFANEHETTYRMLKVYNPWLVSSKLTNKNKKVYEVRVPIK